MTRSRREKRRRHRQAYRGRRKRDGWVHHPFWIPSIVRDQMNLKAAQLGMPKQIICVAALLYGLQHVPTGEIVRQQVKWREKVKPLEEVRFNAESPARYKLAELQRTTATLHGRGVRTEA